MGWSGGTYRKGNYGTNGWTGDASLGIGIEAGRHDTQDDDFANGINACLAKDGSNSATANLNIGANRVTNLGTGTARNDAATVAQVQDRTSSYLGTTGGTSTAFTVTATPTITALTTGAQYVFKANAANGAAATLKIDGTAATTMQRQGTALAGNEFKANDIISVVYDGTNFQITNIAEAPLFVDRTNNRVGIGTTAPSFDLDIQGVATQILATRFSVDTIGARLDFQKSRAASVGSNTIVSNGDILGAVNFWGANGTGYNLAAQVRAEVDGTPGASNDMPGRLIFSTTADGAGSGGERMRIANNGKIGFGTSSPTSFYEFARSANDNSTSLGLVNSDSGSSASCTLHFGNNVSSTAAGIIYNSSANPNNAGNNGMTIFQNAGSGKIRVLAVTGGVELLAGATSWAALSDERLKKNVQPLEYGLTAILQINPIRFDYKTDNSEGSKRVGFIAQELQPVIPESVGGNEETFYSVSATELIPALVNSIKELNAKVEALEARIAALEA